LFENFKHPLTYHPLSIIVSSAMGEFSTDFLTPTSSYLVGAGSAFSLAGNYFEFNGSRTPAEADARALRSDWQVIGQDIATALVEEMIQHPQSRAQK
jgi:hypothetical protein